MNVQAFLGSHVDTVSGYKDKFRSKFNQLPIQEVSVAIIGRGKTFGDSDAYRDRDY